METLPTISKVSSYQHHTNTPLTKNSNTSFAKFTFIGGLLFVFFMSTAYIFVNIEDMYRRFLLIYIINKANDMGAAGYVLRSMTR